MANKTWFNGKSDSKLSQDAIIKKPDLFIAEYLFEGTAIFDDTADDFTVSGAAFTVDEFLSLGLKNLQVLDDNGKVATVKIDSNTATDLLFTQADLKLEEDVTTLAALTNGASYSIRVLTPTLATEPFGKFYGYTEAGELNINDEYAKFKESTPMVLRFQDLLEREVSVVGGNINLSNIDVLSTVFGAELYGLQVGQQSIGIGSNPDVSKSYRLVLNGKDRNNRAMQWVVRKCQAESAGNVQGNSESGHFMVNYNFSVIGDAFYPDTADLLQIIRAD